MKWSLLLFSLLFGLLLSSSLSAQESYPLLEKLQGSWEGKWDNKYGIKFEISRSGELFKVKYFVEEDLGKPYKELYFEGEPLNRNSIMAGPLLFIVGLESKNSVTVVGTFDPGTRTADLRRQ